MTQRHANLLGTISLAIVDRIRDETANEAGSGGEAPAGLVAVATFMAGASIERLSEALGLSHSATVRLVDKLEGRGLVRRALGPNRRTVAVEATRAGRARAERVLAAREDSLDQALEALTVGERRELTRLHEKLLAGIVRAGGPPARVCRLCDARACGHEAGDCPVTEASRPLR